MEYLKIANVRQSNREGINPVLNEAVGKYKRQLGLYAQAIEKLVCGSYPQLLAAEKEIQSNSRTSPSNPVSRLSAPYFVNEDVVGGVLVGESVKNVNQTYGVLGLPQTDGKIKLGPGIGYIEAPNFYSDLLKLGLDTPELAVNYNAPNGEKMTRRGLSLLMNAKAENGSPYGDFDVFLTSGATEAIDAAITTFASTYPGKSVTILGPSYYAASFSSQLRGIPVSQISRSATDAPLFPTIEDIEANTTNNTGLLVLTAPNNPTGEMYSETDLKRLMNLAKKRNMIVLFDDIFGRLGFSPAKNPVQIAQETNALDNIIVVDSLSKTLNIPGLRSGVVATTNPKMKDALSNYLIAVKCNPPLVYGPTLLFEGMARETEKRIRQDKRTRPEKVYEDLAQEVSPQFSKEWFVKAFQEWSGWNNDAMEYYKQNLDFTRKFLEQTGTTLQESPDQGAFNTLIQVVPAGLQANSLDFLFKLMVGTGTYTQTGPCFGLDQSKWDDFMGIWSRITYASDRQSLAEGLTRLAALARLYEERDLGNPSKYPTLTVTY